MRGQCADLSELVSGTSGPRAPSPLVMAGIPSARDKITVVTAQTIRESAQALDASEDCEIGDLSPRASGFNWL